MEVGTESETEGYLKEVFPLIIELQRLKGLDRTGWTLRGRPPGTESVAAHSFGVAVTAMLLADELQSRGVMLDTERVLRMALLHDWAETRVGDLPRTATAYFGSEARRRAESQAFSDMVEGGGAAKALYKDLHDDYERRESLEARVVKAADLIDLLVQVLALERAGAGGLDEFWEAASAREFQLDGAAEDVMTEIVQALLKSRNQVRA